MGLESVSSGVYVMLPLYVVCYSAKTLVYSGPPGGKWAATRGIASCIPLGRPVDTDVRSTRFVYHFIEWRILFGL